jgi:hypothetical protein
MLAGMVKLGDDGTAYVEQANGMGPKLLPDYVKQWAASEGAAFVAKPQGAGAKGGDGKTAKVAGNLAGTREERIAALKAKFPDLP